MGFVWTCLWARRSPGRRYFLRFINIFDNGVASRESDIVLYNGPSDRVLSRVWEGLYSWEILQHHWWHALSVPPRCPFPFHRYTLLQWCCVVRF